MRGITGQLGKDPDLARYSRHFSLAKFTLYVIVTEPGETLSYPGLWSL